MQESPTLTLGVFRRLDNRFEGLSDDSPRALELHNRRRDALHEVFDAVAAVEVQSWGQTDDTQSHEYVELILSWLAPIAFSSVAVPGLKFIGKKLAEKGIDQVTSEVVKSVTAWLRPKQEEKKILDFQIKLADGTSIMVGAPDVDATITINFSNGQVESVNYAASKSDS